MLARASTKRVHCQEGERKDATSWSVAQLGAREMLLRSLSPEYADGPLKLYESDASVFFTSRTVVLAARNGHISISRQRASVN